LVALVLAAPGTAAARESAPGRDSARPHLELRATPSTAFSPATVMVVARLVGGDDSEEFYCPGLEWDWGDGSRSTREGDCAPYDDETKMARLFSLRYRYREAGDFRVRLTLRRAGRTVASAGVSVRVLGRGGDDAPLGIGSAAETDGIRPSNAHETNGR
jgi:hypothetical protein